jgi:hypothetical protein
MPPKGEAPEVSHLLAGLQPSGDLELWVGPANRTVNC